MGQKVNPYGLRLGYTTTWKSRWFATGRQYVDNVEEDIRLRAFFKKELASAAVARIDIERTAEQTFAIIHTARPGVIIGRRGAEIDRLESEVQRLAKHEVKIRIQEIKTPAAEAQLIAENVAFQLVRRIAFRRAMKRAIQMAMESGVKGIKIQVDGRLGGLELSRREWYLQGALPLGTLRTAIDYGFAEARTTFGCIGVKVWVNKGDVQFDRPTEVDAQPQDSRARRQPSTKAPADVSQAPSEERVAVAPDAAPSTAETPKAGASEAKATEGAQESG